MEYKQKLTAFYYNDYFCHFDLMNDINADALGLRFNIC